MIQQHQGDRAEGDMGQDNDRGVAEIVARVTAAPGSAKMTAITAADLALLARLSPMAQVDACNALASIDGVSKRALMAEIKRAKRPIRSVRAGEDARPVIRVIPGQLVAQVRAAISALASRDPNLFQRNQEIVAVVREAPRAGADPTCEGRDSSAEPCEVCGALAAEPCATARRVGARMLQRPGTPTIASLTASALAERLAAVADWIAPDDSDDWKPCDPPARVVAMIHERKEWDGIRPLRGIAESPFLRPDMTVCDVPGYDAATGFYYAPSADYPAIPRKPSRAEGAAALRRLWVEAFCDFPYVGMPRTVPGAPSDGEARFGAAASIPDAFVGIAMIETVLARPAIDGAAPSFMFEAAAQGSGKTKHLHAVSIIATGRAAAVATFPMSRGRPNEEEQEKVFAGYAIGGAAIVNFDNITGVFGGATLAKYQTAIGTVGARVLGFTGQKEVEWSGVIGATGNNASMDDDAAQRTLVSRMESDLDDPRSRERIEFRHANLFHALRGLRPALAVDALIVLLSYANASAEERATIGAECGSLGSFEAWSEIVPRAIRYCGGPNVLDARIKSGSTDTEGAAHDAIMAHWPSCFADYVKPKDILIHAFKQESEILKNLAPDDGMSELRGAIRDLTNAGNRDQPTPAKFGTVLKRLRGKWRNGRKIGYAEDKHTKNIVYRVESRSTDAAPAVPMVATAPIDPEAAALAALAAERARLDPDTFHCNMTEAAE